MGSSFQGEDALGAAPQEGTLEHEIHLPRPHGWQGGGGGAGSGPVFTIPRHQDDNSVLSQSRVLAATLTEPEHRSPTARVGLIRQLGDLHLTMEKVGLGEERERQERNLHTPDICWVGPRVHTWPLITIPLTLY